MIETVTLILAFICAWWLGGKITEDSFSAGYDQCIKDILKVKED